MCFYSIRFLFINWVLLWPSGRAQMRPPKPGALFLDCLNTQTFLMATGVGRSVCLSLSTLYTPWRPSNYASFGDWVPSGHEGQLSSTQTPFLGRRSTLLRTKCGPHSARYLFAHIHMHTCTYAHTHILA